MINPEDGSREHNGSRGTPGSVRSRFEALPTLDRRASLLLVAVFAVSRIAFYIAGVRFDSQPITSYWQYLDLGLLRTDLLRSLWYLHSQPPLFNFLLGVTTKVAPANEGVLLAVLFRGLGLILALAMFLLMRELEIGRKAAFWLTVAVVVSPATILYENYAFYTYPVTVGLVVMALFLKLFLDDHRLFDGMMFFGLAAAVALTRSLFHILWIFAIAAGVVMISREDRMQAIRAALIPVLLVTAVYLKNLAVFGFFGVSSWLGMNLAIVTVFPLEHPVRQQLIEDGTLSQYALYSPFQRPEVYGLGIGTTGIDALDNPVKDGGHVNFNHIGYIEVSRRYMEDALRALTVRPDGAVRGVLAAAGFYFRPANEYYYVRENRDRISVFDAAFNSVFYGRPLYRDNYDRPESGRPISWYVRGLLRVSPTVVVLYLATILIGFMTLFDGIRKRRFTPAAATLVFTAGTVLWITVFGVSLEVRENNRFRFPGEPLAVATVAAGVAHWNRRRGAPEGNGPIDDSADNTGRTASAPAP